MSFWHNQKAKLLAELKQMAEGVDMSEQIKKYNKNISRQVKTKSFMGKHSDEVKHEVAFEENCIILSQYTNKVVKDMTTKEYFTLLSHHNEKIRKNGRQSNKSR